MKKNLLVAYEGGGYDGCIWEWNYFLFDSNGKFHNIYSSGSMGIKTEDEAVSIIDNLKNPRTYSHGTGIYVYNLENKDDIINFQETHNAGQVVKLVEMVNKIYRKNKQEEPVFFICDICGCEVGGGNSCDPQGAGGIVIVNTTKVCEDCYSSHTCGKCGEFDKDWEFDNEENLCECCLEEKQAIEEDFLEEEKLMQETIADLDKLHNEYQAKRKNT